MRQGSRMSVSLCLSSRHFGPPPRLALRFLTTAKKKSPSRAQNEEGTKVLCANGLPHKPHEGQRFTRLRSARKGQRDRTEDMEFSTFMFEGKESRNDYASTDRRG